MGPNVHTLYNVILRIKEFSGNQGNHQNFDPSIIPYKFGLILMGMKQKIKNKLKNKLKKKNQNGRLKKN